MNPVRVLIVDDSSVMRKIVDRSLRQAGLEIKEAGSARVLGVRLRLFARPWDFMFGC